MGLTTLSRRAPEHLPQDAYDVRGWEVRTEPDGRSVGTVDDMLLDEADRPRYLDVDLGTFRKHVLVPLSEAHADPSAQVVWIDRLDRDRVKELPGWDHDTSVLSPAYEARLMEEYRLLAESDGGERGSDRSSLARLGDLDGYGVAKGVTDPRGWKLVGGDGSQLGKVEELIVDTAALSTRYFDCSIREDKLGLEPVGRHLLVPADRVRLDRKRKHVVADGLFARDVEEYPVYRGLPLEAGDERHIRAAWERGEDGGTDERGVRRFFAARPTPTAEPAQPRSRGRPERSGTVEPAESMHAGSEPRTEAEGSPSQQRIRRDEGDEVRIRIAGGDIIIERHARERRDDG